MAQIQGLIPTVTNSMNDAISMAQACAAPQPSQPLTTEVRIYGCFTAAGCACRVQGSGTVSAIFMIKIIRITITIIITIF